MAQNEQSPTVGPAIPAAPRHHHDLSRFAVILENLQDWRDEDHADAITLHRSQIIEIIEGVKEVRQKIVEAHHVVNAARSICDEVQITRSYIPNKIATLIDAYKALPSADRRSV